MISDVDDNYLDVAQAIENALDVMQFYKDIFERGCSTKVVNIFLFDLDKD